MRCGKFRSGAAANGVSRADPLAMSAQVAAVPTTVSDAAVGWAQPLAQPETWTVIPSLRYGAAASATLGASARAAI